MPKMRRLEIWVEMSGNYEKKRQMLGEEGKIVKNFASETEVKEKSSYQTCVWRLKEGRCLRRMVRLSRGTGGSGCAKVDRCQEFVRMGSKLGW